MRRGTSRAGSAVVGAVVASLLAAVLIGVGTPGVDAAPAQDPVSPTVVDPCDDYTPADLVVTPTSAAPGAELAVSGTGEPGTMVQVALRSDDGAEPFVALSDPALVQPDGTWSTTILVPGDAAPGTWIVAAQALGCETETTTEIDVTEVAAATTTPTPGPSVPEVAGISVDAPPLEGAAFGSGAGGPGSSAPGGVAGLAFTGSTAHVLLVLGLVSLGLGTMVLLSARRRIPATD